ncbi:MAG: HD-GYP domain-containing protein [Mycobacteriales bacterium]
MASAAVVAGVFSAFHVTRWADVLVFAVLFTAADRFRSTATTLTSVSMSVSFIVGLAAIFVTGAYGGCLVALLGGIMTNDRDWPRRLFNPSQYAVTALSAGAAFSLFNIQGEGLVTAPLWQLVAATITAALTNYVVSPTLIAVIVSLTTGLSVRRVWSTSFSWAAFGYMGYGVLGLLLAVLWTDLGVVAAIVLMLPLLVARAAFANYAEQRATYDATVRALVQAVETKDYYTRGHSERVSLIAERIARESGMREDRVEIARYAGMLHDVGKLGVPTKVLQKQGKLNGDEFDAIKLHPLHGYEMLCEIEFLREALSGVYHHHERLDGRGYPMGLAGDEIPEFARVIMVADAFDSMTSTRSYRNAKSVDEAVAELQRCQDIQFDGKVVANLVEAVRKHGWEPTPEDFGGEQVARDVSVLRGSADQGVRRAHRA